MKAKKVGRRFIIALSLLGVILGSQACSTIDKTRPTATPTEVIVVLSATTRQAEPEIISTVRTEIVPTPSIIPRPTAVFAGPLTAKEKRKLSAAAESYLASTPDELNRVLERLEEESISHIDGPLAAAILKDAGIISSATKLHRFWLLDPVSEPGQMEFYFPHTSFEWINIKKSGSGWDYSVTPLYAGDLIFLKPASKEGVGRFLLVNRTDENGVVYSVSPSAEQSGKGTRIEEVLLFDPSQPVRGLLGKSDGLFTQSGGAVIYRKRDYSQDTEFAFGLNKTINQGGEWHVVVKQVGSAIEFERGADSSIHPASIIKLPIGMLVVKMITGQDQELETSLQSAPPRAGRTYEQLLRAMLVLSEETATDILEGDLRSQQGEAWIRQSLDAWNARGTILEPRRSTATDIAGLWECLYDHSCLGDKNSNYLLSLLAEKTSGDAVRLWRLAPSLPVGSVIYNKRGSLTNPLIVADAGIIVLPDGRAFILCLFGYPDGWTGFEKLDQIIGDFANAWYQVRIVENLAP
jgi:hypothetical protein